MSRRLFAYCGPRRDLYASPMNIKCIQETLLCLLGVEIDASSICMVMKNIRDDPNQYEGIRETDSRVIAYIVDHYNNYLREGNVHRSWAEHFRDSQLIINPVGKTGPDFNAVKVANRYGECRVGGSLNFHFT